ncbi:hypothetical protein CKF54_07330, partial [Psittacicella hinzii]
MIKVQNDGTIALVGGQVSNTGVLEAKNGTVYLLAGQSIVIQDLENPLISYKVTANNKAVNLGNIVAKKAYLLANKVANGLTSTVGDTFADLVTLEGNANKAVIKANGEIQLFGATESTQFQTNRQVNSEVVGTHNSLVVNNGTLNASSETSKGGTISLLGDVVGVEESSYIAATGTTGGLVYVGGDAKGRGTNVKLADETLILSGSTIDVSGQGDAGQVYTWGNTSQVEGTFIARSVEGHGGFVETSGNSIRVIPGHFSVDTSSAKGEAYTGQWLLDPTDLVIYNGTADNTNWKGDGSSSKAYYESLSSGVGRYSLNKSGKTTYEMTDGTVNMLLANGTVSRAAFYTDGNITIRGDSRISHSEVNSSKRELTFISQKDVKVQSGAQITAGYLNLTSYNGNINVTGASIRAGYSVEFYITQIGNITVDSSTVVSNRQIWFNLDTDASTANRFIKITNSTIDMTGSLATDKGLYLTFNSNSKASIIIENNSKLLANTGFLSIGINDYDAEKSAGQYINVTDSAISGNYNYLWSYSDVYFNNATISAATDGNFFSKEGRILSGEKGFTATGNNIEFVGYYGVDVDNVTTHISGTQEFVSNTSSVEISNSALSGSNTETTSDAINVYGLDSVKLFNTTVNASTTSVYSVVGGLNLTDSTVKGYTTSTQTPVYLGQFATSSITTTPQSYNYYDADSVLDNTTIISGNNAYLGFQAPNSSQQVTLKDVKLNAPNVTIATEPDTGYSASRSIKVENLTGSVSNQLFFGINQTNTDQAQQTTSFIVKDTTDSLSLGNLLVFSLDSTVDANFNVTDSNFKFTGASSKAYLFTANTAGSINVENSTFDFATSNTDSKLEIYATKNDASAVNLRVKDLTVNNAKDVKLTNGTQSTTGSVTVNNDGNLTYLTNHSSSFDTAFVTAGNVTLNSATSGHTYVNNSLINGKTNLEVLGNNVTTNKATLTTDQASAKSPKIEITGTAELNETKVTGYGDLTAKAGTFNATDSTFNASEGASNYDVSGANINLDNVTFVNSTATTLVKLQATDAINVNNTNLQTNRYEICATNNVRINNSTLEAHNTATASKLDTSSTAGTLEISNNSTLVVYTEGTVNATGNLVITDSTVDLTKATNADGSNNATLQSLNANATFANFTLKRNGAESSTVTLKAKENLSITQGTIVEGYSVTLESQNNAINIKDSNISAFYTAADGKSGGYPKITAQKDIVVDNSNITGWQKLVFTSNQGNVTFNESTITVKDLANTGEYSGDLEVVTKSNAGGAGQITLAHSRVVSDPNKSNISLVAAAGISTLEDTTLEGRKINLTAQSGSIDLQSSAVHSTGDEDDALVLSATEKLILNSSIVVANQDITLDSAAGNVKSLEVTNGSTIQSVNGNVTVDFTSATSGSSGSSYIFTNSSLIAEEGTAKLAVTDDLTTTGSTFRGKEVNVTSTAGSVTLINSEVEATGENAKPTIKTANALTLNNTAVIGNGDITLTADAGDLTIINGSSVTSNKGSVTVESTGSTGTLTISNATLHADQTVTLNQSGTTGTSTLDGVRLISDNANVELKSSASSLVLKNSELSAVNGTANYQVTNDLTLDHSAIRVKDDLVFAQDTVGGTLRIVNGSALQSSAGKVDVTIANSDEFSNSSIIAATDANLTKETGDLELKGSDIVIQGKNVNLKAKDGSIALGDTTITGVPDSSGAGDINIVAESSSGGTATVTVLNSTISEFSNANLNGATGAVVNNSTITGTDTGYFTVNGGTGTTSVTKSSITRFIGATVEAEQDVTLDNATFTGTGGGDFKVVSTEGTITATNTEVSQFNTLNATSKGDLTLTGFTTTGSGNGDVIIESTEGKLAVKDSTIDEYNNVNLDGNSGVDLNNVTATGKGRGSFNVNSFDGPISIENSTVTDYSNVWLSAYEEIELDNLTATGTSSGDFYASSGNSTLKVANTTITEFNNATLDGDKGVTLEDSEVTGTDKGDFNLTTANGTATLADTEISRFNNLNVKGDQGANLDNVTATGTGTGEFSVESANGSTTLTDSTVTQFKDVTLSGETGVTVEKVEATGAGDGDFTIETNGTATLDNSTVTKFNDVTVSGVTGATVDNVTATGTGGGDFTVTSSEGTAAVANSTVTKFNDATVSGDLGVTVKDVIATGTGNGNFKADSANGTVALADSEVTEFSNVELDGKEGITLQDLVATGTESGFFTATSSDGAISLADSEITKFNYLKLDSKLDATVENVTATGTGAGDFEVTSEEGTTTVKNSTVTQFNNAKLDGDKGVTVENVTSTGTGAGDFTVNSDNGPATLVASTITQYNNLNATSKEDVTVENVTATGTGKGDFNLVSSEGTATLKDSTVSEFNNLKVDGDQEATVENVTATGTGNGDFTVHSDKGTSTLTDSTVTKFNNLTVDGDQGATVTDVTATGTGEGNFTVTSEQGATSLTDSTVEKFKNLIVEADKDSEISNLDTTGTGEGVFKNTSKNGSATVKDSTVEQYKDFTNSAKDDAVVTNVTTTGTGEGDFTNESSDGKAVVTDSKVDNYNNLNNKGETEATIENVTTTGSGKGDFNNESNGTATVKDSTVENYNNLNNKGKDDATVENVTTTGTGEGSFTNESTEGKAVVKDSTVESYNNLNNKGKEEATVTNVTTTGTGKGDFNNESSDGKAVVTDSKVDNYNNLNNKGETEATIDNVTTKGSGNGDFN